MHENPDPTPESLLVHSAFLKRVVRFMVTDGNEADDVVQEVWVAALKRPPQNFDAARSWLWRVASNVVRLRIRTAARVRKREQLRARPEVAPSTDEIREREAARSAVLESLLTLAPEHREVLLLRFFEELSWKEVAQRLGVPMETARTRAKRARVALRFAVEERTRADGRSLLTLIPLFELQHAQVLPRWGLLQVARAAVLLLGLATVGWFGAIALSDADTEPHSLADLQLENATSPPTDLVEASPTLRTRTPADAPPEGQTGDAIDLQGRILGRCVDEYGKPVASASVRLAGLQGHRRGHAASAEARTDANGRFSIAGAPLLTQPTVLAHKAGHVPVLAHVRPGQDAGDLLLRRTGAVHIIVRDRTTDEPLAGVKVTYRMDGGLASVPLSSVTDTAGAATIALPPAGRQPERMQVALTKHGYAPRLVHAVGGKVRGSHGASDTPREIYLEASSGVPVRVLDASGAAAPHVRVQAWSCPRTRGYQAAGSQFRDASWHSVIELGEGQTNAAGEFPIAEAPHGTTVVVVAEAEDAAALAILPTYRGRRGGAITLKLRPAMSIHGRVFAGDSPAPGARVSIPLAVIGDPVLVKTRLRGLPPAPLADWLRLVCDEHGAFRSRLLPVATHGVTHAIEARVAGRKVGRTSLPPDYDGSEGLRIELPRARTQRVKVTDARGTPVAGAHILDAFRGVDAATDHAGLATIALPKEGNASLQVLAPGFTRGTATAAGTRSVLTVRLERSRGLAGKIIDDASGAGVRARIVLHRLSAVEGAQRMFLAHAFTGESGAFSFDDVGDGPWLAVVTRGEEATSTNHRINSARAPVTLRVRRASASSRLATLTGVVLDADAEAITHYTARLRPTDRPVSPYRADMEGARFEFHGIPAGAYRLEIQAGTRTKRMPIEIEGGSHRDDLRISLGAWAKLKGTIEGLDGTGSTRPQMVQLRRKGDLPGRYAVRLMDEKGRFAFDRLVPATYELAVVGARGETYWIVADASVSIREGETREHTTGLRPAGRIMVHAVGSSWGRPLGSGAPRVYREARGVTVPRPRRMGTGAPAARPTSTAPTLALVHPDGTRTDLGRVIPGKMAIENALAPGNYELVVKRGDAESREPVTVRAGSTSLVELR